MKIGIVACGAIVREMIAIANRQGWGYELTAVPVQYHNTPQKITPAVADRLDEWADRFDLILVGYADCGTLGELDALLDNVPNAVRIPGPHCYEFYGGDAFDKQAEEYPGTFYLTDFLAHHFENVVWKGLKLDLHPELKKMFFGNYTHLFYLKQLPDQAESARAQAAAKRLGVAYREAESGIDVLEERLVALVESWKQKSALDT